MRTNLFKKSNIEAELKRFGAKELTLPVVTSITLLAIKRAEAKAGRKLSFAEVATPGATHLELMLAGEMQWAMQQMFRQCDLIADLLVPSGRMKVWQSIFVLVALLWFEGQMSALCRVIDVPRCVNPISLNRFSKLLRVTAFV